MRACEATYGRCSHMEFMPCEYCPFDDLGECDFVEIKEPVEGGTDD